jgi:hypothetical protein
MARLTAHWDVTNWHWTLTEWSDLIEGAGFRIERLREPRPTATQAAANPSFEPARRLPYFLVVELSQRPAARRPRRSTGDDAAAELASGCSPRSRARPVPAHAPGVRISPPTAPARRQRRHLPRATPTG